MSQSDGKPSDADKQGGQRHIFLKFGLLLQRKGDHDKAISCYHRILAQDPTHYKAHYNMALSYIAKQQPAGDPWIDATSSSLQ